MLYREYLLRIDAFQSGWEDMMRAQPFGFLAARLKRLAAYFRTFARTHSTKKNGSPITSTSTPAGNPTSRYVST